MRRILLPCCLAAAISAVAASAKGPRFYDDDPIARAPESQDASGAQPIDISLLYEYAFNLIATANHKPSNTRAGNVNTIDEVPDSGWFTNRIGTRPFSEADLVRGGIVGRPPAPEKWVVTREKSAGTNPGFTARDANGETWFLEFDSPDRPEGESGAIQIATRIFWALGYNQVELFVTTFDPQKAEIDPKATLRRPSGARTPLTRQDLEEVLGRTARNADGTYRVSAGRLLSGKVLGSFRYSGTRPDDPNDLVPHQHRRELRALRVFGAWTNLVDLKAGNTLDALETGPSGRPIVKHYLQDVGSTFGMANNQHEWDMGWEYFFEMEPTKRRLRTFGFSLSPWQTVPYTQYESVGPFEGVEFDPKTWRPQTPTTPYMEMRADDAFWAARRVAAFTDDMIRAAVHTGQFSDAAAERHLGAVLIQRRDKILQAYLPALNPIVNPRLDANGTLQFDNAAVDARVAPGPASYRSTWLRFDNLTERTEAIGAASSASTTIAAPRGLPSRAGEYVAVDISAESGAHQSWQQPVRAYFRRTSSGWALAGLDRQP